MADKDAGKEGALSVVAPDKKKTSMSAASTSGPKTESKPRAINATYNKETDTDIFALGEAASCLDNLDDVLTGFGLNVKDMLTTDEVGGGGGGSAGSSFPSEVERRASAPTPGSGYRLLEERSTELPAGNSVQVSTVSRSLPDGRKIQTQIIEGPAHCKQRIVRVMRETPNGQELIAELEVAVDADINKVLDSIPQYVLISGHPIAMKRRSSNGQYDNWSNDQTSAAAAATAAAIQHSSAIPQPPTMNERVEQSKPVLPNGGFIKTPLSMSLPRPSDAGEQLPPTEIADGTSSPKPAAMKRVSFRKTSTPSSEYDVGSQPDGLNRVMRRRYESVTEEDIRRYLPLAGLQSVQEDDTSGTAAEGVDDDREHSCCWSCAKVIKSKSKSMPKSFIELSKGKLCMTASEINEDDRCLPAPQAIVANYARMLVENRAQFVETMFRAVKLNKLDVTKILCKIIHKCGLKLGHHDFRETESSATILHVALLYNHVDIVDFLLEFGDRELILAKYETEEYHNQTSLHVAVANGNTALVEKLIEALDTEDQVTLVNTLADGHYFREQHPHGQLCLTAAAWAGSGQIIKTIVRFGGNLAIKNLSGNTLLHSIILQAAQHPGRNDYKTLFDSVLEATAIWAEQMNYDSKFAQQRELEKSQMCINLFKELLNCRNNDGFTPLALAVVKNSKLFHHMINLEKIYKIPQNKLGSIAWVTYDVTEITSFARNVYNKFSVLHILAHNSQHLSRRANLEQDEDYMETEPIKTLLTRKWDVYRWIYILWFVVHLSYMIVFTAATSETNSSCYNTTICSMFPPLPTRNGLVMFIILPIFYVALELLDLFGSQPYRVQYMTGQSYAGRLIKGVMSEWTITGNGPYRMVSVGFSAFTIYWYVLYSHRDEYQDMGLAMSLLLGWIFVLFFTRGCRVTCRFSIMIQKMFFRDLIYFLTVYAIVLVGFSFAMNIMFEEKNISKVFYDMMSVVTDLDQKQTVIKARHPTFAKLMLIFYAIIAVILLMNMLIAMMNTSYETVRVTRCNLWRQQQLSILLMIERRFFWFKWLCNKSERDVWRKDPSQPAEIQRCYIDVTMLHTPSYKCV